MAATTLYFDNDARFHGVFPATATVNWAVVEDLDANIDAATITPVDASLAGTMTYSATRRRHEAVIEGDSVRNYLDPAKTYAIVAWFAQNARQAIRAVVVKTVRPR